MTDPSTPATRTVLFSGPGWGPDIADLRTWLDNVVENGAPPNTRLRITNNDRPRTWKIAAEIEVTR